MTTEADATTTTETAGAPIEAAPAAPAPASAATAPEAAKPVLTFTPDAFAARLERERVKLAQEARTAALKELGIEDPSSFKKEREELSKFKAEEEKRQRAALSEQQRLKLDLDRALKERDDVRQQLKDTEESRISDQQEAFVRDSAMKHIDADLLDAARYQFLQHIQRIMKDSPAELDAMTEKDVERFFKDLAKSKPRWARQEAAPAKTEPTKKPITNGAPVARRPGAPTAQPSNGPGTVAGKTFKPGQPNSMTKQELNAALKAQGIRTW